MHVQAMNAYHGKHRLTRAMVLTLMMMMGCAHMRIQSCDSFGAAQIWSKLFAEMGYAISEEQVVLTCIAFTSVAQLTEHCKGRKHRDAEGRQRGGGGRGRGRAPGGGGGAPPPWARGGGG